MSEHERMEEIGEHRLSQRAKGLFDESVRELDAETVSRLNRGRQRAVAEMKPAGARGSWSRWLPAAAVAMAAGAVVVVWRPRLGTDALPAATPSDAEILLAEDELEMLEDLDFYRWMALEANEDEPGAGDDVG